MGGRSSGTIERTAEGTLRFEGSLSLENNGGFASFRSGRLDRLDWDLDGSEGPEIRTTGDGRPHISPRAPPGASSRTTRTTSYQ